MRKIVIAVCALLAATPALADGYSVKDSVTTNRPVRCYVKAYGAGEFVTKRVDMGIASIDSLGQNGVGVGGQVGCDYSSSLFLIGAFADYTWNNVDIRATVAGVDVMKLPFRSEASIGGRLGVHVTANTLLYGLAAYTAAQEGTATMVGIPIGLSSGPKGATLGGGLEVAVTDKIILSLEYRHTGFDTSNATLLPMKVDTVENQVLAGIAYRF